MMREPGWFGICIYVYMLDVCALRAVGLVGCVVWRCVDSKRYSLERTSSRGKHSAQFVRLLFMSFNLVIIHHVRADWNYAFKLGG